MKKIDFPGAADGVRTPCRFAAIFKKNAGSLHWNWGY